MSQFSAHDEVYFRESDDGVNLIWSFSVDGVYWQVYDTQTRTDFLAAGPTRVGVFGRTENTNTWITQTIIDWTVTTP